MRILTSALFASWQRPGAVKNVTLSEFSGAVVVDNAHIVSVMDHKTGVGGAARLVLTPVVQQGMQVTYIRPCLVDDDSIVAVTKLFLLPGGIRESPLPFAVPLYGPLG